MTAKNFGLAMLNPSYPEDIETLKLKSYYRLDGVLDTYHPCFIPYSLDGEAITGLDTDYAGQMLVFYEPNYAARGIPIAPDDAADLLWALHQTYPYAKMIVGNTTCLFDEGAGETPGKNWRALLYNYLDADNHLFDFIFGEHWCMNPSNSGEDNFRDAKDNWYDGGLLVTYGGLTEICFNGLSTAEAEDFLDLLHADEQLIANFMFTNRELANDPLWLSGGNLIDSNGDPTSIGALLKNYQ